MSSCRALKRVARVLTKLKGSHFQVAGHTDNVGNDNWNIGLSLRRAYTVRNFLIAQGVAPERITARGYGPYEPIADNATEDGRAMNRRVELRVAKP